MNLKECVNKIDIGYWNYYFQETTKTIHCLSKEFN